MRTVATLAEANTIQVPCTHDDGEYAAIVVRIDIHGVERTQQILLQCSSKHYKRLRDACGSEKGVKAIFDGIAGNIVNEEDELNYIYYDTED